MHYSLTIILSLALCLTVTASRHMVMAEDVISSDDANAMTLEEKIADDIATLRKFGQQDLARELERQKIYALKINVKAAIPSNVKLACFLRQITPQEYNLKGETKVDVTKPGEVTLRLLLPPEDAPNRLFQIAIGNHLSICDNKGVSDPNLLLYLSKPFRLHADDFKRPLEFVVEQIPAYPMLGIQKLQFVDLKGRKYPKLHFKVALFTSNPANNGQEGDIAQFNLTTDAEGVSSLSLFEGVNLRMVTTMGLCLYSRPSYTDGVNEVVYSDPYISDFLVKLAEGPAASFKTEGVKQLPVDLGPCLVAKVYEMVDGKEQLSEKASLLHFDDQSKDFI